MKIITFISLKGGSGKTSAALNIGATLARSGYNVLFVDLDSQNSLADTLTTQNSTGALWPVLDGQTRLKDAIMQCQYGALINRGSDPAEPADIYALKEALKTVSDEYDFVIIDTPPALSATTVSGIIAADGLVLPVLAHPYSLKSLSRLFVTLEELQTGEQIKTPAVYGILLNQYHARQNICSQTAEQFRILAKKHNTVVFQTAIRESVNVPESQALHMSIYDYNKRAAPAFDYYAVTIELLNSITKTNKPKAAALPHKAADQDKRKTASGRPNQRRKAGKNACVNKPKGKRS